MRVPVKSAGSISGVNCRRRNFVWIVAEMVLTAVVLARPGTPSKRIWPLAKSPTRSRSRRSLCPTITFWVSNKIPSIKLLSFLTFSLIAVMSEWVMLFLRYLKQNRIDIFEINVDAPDFFIPDIRCVRRRYRCRRNNHSLCATRISQADLADARPIGIPTFRIMINNENPSQEIKGINVGRQRDFLRPVGCAEIIER